MEFELVDLGVCRGCVWRGDRGRVALGLPGAMSVGAPALIFCLQAIVRQGWSAIQVVDEFHDRNANPTAWVTERALAALSTYGVADRTLVVAKSLSTRAAGLVAERGFPAVWLTPLLDHEESVGGLRLRTAPALLVGGTADPAWNGALARTLSDDVLELEGVDHGFGRAGDDPVDTLDNLKRVVEAVTTFAGRF